MSDAAQIKVPGARCPYCHDRIEGPAGLVACAACGARAHRICHQEHPTCASCGAAEILVPPSTTRAELVPLPPRSVLEVERSEDRLSISWPTLPRTQRRAALCFALVMMPLLCTGVLVLWWLWLHWNDRVRLDLTEESIELVNPGQALWLTPRTLRCARIDVRMIERERGPNVWVHAAPKGRTHVAGTPGIGTVLAAADVDWLHETLHAWLQGRLALGLPEPAPDEAANARPPKPSPKRVEG